MSLIKLYTRTNTSAPEPAELDPCPLAKIHPNEITLSLKIGAVREDIAVGLGMGCNGWYSRLEAMACERMESAS